MLTYSRVFRVFELARFDCAVFECLLIVLLQKNQNQIFLFFSFFFNTYSDSQQHYYQRWWIGLSDIFGIWVGLSSQVKLWRRWAFTWWYERCLWNPKSFTNVWWRYVIFLVLLFVYCFSIFETKKEVSKKIRKFEVRWIHYFYLSEFELGWESVTKNSFGFIVRDFEKTNDIILYFVKL